MFHFSQANFSLSSSEFSDNIANPIFYVENAVNILVDSIRCGSIKVKGDLSCFHMKNILSFTMKYSKILNSFSSIAAPGIIIESNQLIHSQVNYIYIINILYIYIYVIIDKYILLLVFFKCNEIYISWLYRIIYIYKCFSLDKHREFSFLCIIIIFMFNFIHLLNRGISLILLMLLFK